jgi:hypothetical protein
MAGIVHIPWYATVFRGDKLEAAIAEIAPKAMRYGAKSYEVFRYRDDRYKFIQTAEFDDHIAWDRYWQGPEFIYWRTKYQSYYQVPVVYGWTDLIASGTMLDEAANGERSVVGNGHAETGDLAG